MRDTLQRGRPEQVIARRREIDFEISPQTVWIFECPYCGKEHSLEPGFETSGQRSSGARETRSAGVSAQKRSSLLNWLHDSDLTVLKAAALLILAVDVFKYILWLILN